MFWGDFYTFLAFDMDFCDNAAECGLRSFIIMAGALDGKAVKSELLSYEGPFGVGYAVAAFEITGADDTRQFDRIYNEKEEQRLNRLKDNEDEYVRLARKSLESYILHNKKISRPDNLPKEMLNQKAGVFVSLKMNGQLRGCIGTIAPTTDPIEKKPLKMFYPGSKILSVGSFGCNLKCSFCQNNDISMAGKNELETQFMYPEDLIQLAMDLRPKGNIGIAYTYNEPLVGYEYAYQNL
jgi:hypothetical protein